MTIASASPTGSVLTDRQTNAVLVVSRENLDVRYVSPLAVTWLGLPAERLMGRSLIVSVPVLGQALTRLIAAGVGAERTAIHVPLAITTGDPLTTHVHQTDQDLVIDFQLPEKPETVMPDLLGLQRRLDEMRQDLAVLRSRAPGDDTLLRGHDPILCWLWQAEMALAQISRRFAELAPAPRRPTTASHRRTP